MEPGLTHFLQASAESPEGMESGNLSETWGLGAGPRKPHSLVPPVCNGSQPRALRCLGTERQTLDLSPEKPARWAKGGLGLCI